MNRFFARVGLSLAMLWASAALAANEVKVTADNFTVNEEVREAVFTGNVVVVHPTLDLWADKVTISYGEGGTSDIRTFEATSNVRIKTKDQDATGDRAVYDPKTQIVRLSGNVKVINASSTLTGPELVVDLSTNTSTFTGVGGGRVTGVFRQQ